MNVQEESNKLIEELEKENKELKKENKKLKDKNKGLEYCNEKLRCDNNYFEHRILFEMRQNKEILKLNETILKENDNKSEQLEKCKKLLIMAVNELEEQMNNLCETVEDMDSVYSPCSICLNQIRCKYEECEGIKWIHANEVREVLEDEH